MKRENRESNFELLRIIAIFFIIMHHLLIKFENLHYIGNLSVSHSNVLVDSLLNSHCVIGVNLFILISGYWGISSVKRSLIRLLRTFLWCALILTTWDGFNSFFYLDFRNWWFIDFYLVLLLLSPLIEKSLKDITLTTLSHWIVVLTIVNVVFGWWWKWVNTDGYSWVNFVYLYYLGRWIHRILIEQPTWLPKKKNLILIGCGIYLICSTILSICFCVKIQYLEMEGHRWWAYNNPFVVMSSIAFFVCFAQISSLSSRWINFFAKGCFATYILHTKEIFHINILNHIDSIFIEYGYQGLFVFALLVLASLIVFTSVVEFVIWKIVSFIKNTKTCPSQD